MNSLLEQKIIPDDNELTIAFNRLLTEKPKGALRVNGKEHSLKIGSATPSGFYSNGWKTIDVRGDGKFKQLNIYTALHNEVAYDVRAMFKKNKSGEWKLVVLKGLYDTDLLAIEGMGNNDTYMLDYINALLNRSKETEEEEDLVGEK